MSNDVLMKGMVCQEGGDNVVERLVAGVRFLRGGGENGRMAR